MWVCVCVCVCVGVWVCVETNKSKWLNFITLLFVKPICASMPPQQHTLPLTCQHTEAPIKLMYKEDAALFLFAHSPPFLSRLQSLTEILRSELLYRAVS